MTSASLVPSEYGLNCIEYITTKRHLECVPVSIQKYFHHERLFHLSLSQIYFAHVSFNQTMTSFMNHLDSELNI